MNNKNSLIGTAIYVGLFDKDRVYDVLLYLEKNYNNLTWCTGTNPTGFIPHITEPRPDERKEDCSSYYKFVLLIDYDGDLAWCDMDWLNSDDNDEEYNVIDADEFIGLTELENEIDISFLYGG